MTHHFHIATVIAVLLASSRTLSLADQIVPAPHTPIMLDLPARCQLGETCWVVNYVDVDPGLTAKDFRCEARTYDGHDGIDLAIRDRGVMEQGVPVLMENFSSNEGRATTKSPEYAPPQCRSLKRFPPKSPSVFQCSGQTLNSLGKLLDRGVALLYIARPR